MSHEIYSQPPVRRPLTKAAARYLGSLPRTYDAASKTAIDVACGSGTTCRAFVERGYALVVGLNASTEQTDHNRYAAYREGYSLDRLRFSSKLAQAAEKYKLPIEYDVVLFNEALFGKNKNGRATAVEQVQRYTSLNGTAVVSGFMWDEKLERNKTIADGRALRQRLLQPGELEKLFTQPSWQIEEYDESTMQVQQANGLYETPHALVIARKTSEG